MSDEKKSMLGLKDIYKTFDAVQALKGINNKYKGEEVIVWKQHKIKRGS